MSIWTWYILRTFAPVHIYSAIPFFRVLADSRFLPKCHNHVFRVLASSVLAYVQYDFARWPILHIPVTYIKGHLQGFVTADRAVHMYLYYDNTPRQIAQYIHTYYDQTLSCMQDRSAELARCAFPEE